MNIPNSLTVARAAITPLGVLALLLPQVPYRITIAAVIFVLAAFSDWLDGYLARKWKQTSNFGAFMDPLADKVVVMLYFAFFMKEGVYPLWLFMLVLARDLINDAYRSFAASKRVVIGANQLGKAKTALQMASLCAVLLAYVVNEWTPAGMRIEQRLIELGNVAMICALILGVLGSYQFISKYVSLLHSDE